MSAVESILAVATAKSVGDVPMRGGRGVVDHAVWFCACSGLEDAPTWLIYETSGGIIGWRRVPDGSEIADLVEASVTTGDHVDPAEVLDWLQDKTAVSVPGAGPANRAVIREMGRRIRDLQSD